MASLLLCSQLRVYAKRFSTFLLIHEKQSQKIFVALTPVIAIKFLSADDFFVDDNGEYIFDGDKIKEAHNYCQVRCSERMRQGIARIVVANTFTQEWEMKTYFEMAERYNYRVHTIIVENRHGNENIHGVPKDKLQQMKNRFEIKL